MKARVKATGEIISVKVYNKGFDYNGRQFINYEDMKSHKTYTDNQLDFDNTDNSPDDYWTRLEHQYAGMFMRSFLDNFDGTASMEQLTESAIDLARAFIQKLKGKEERK